ncbi:MAG: SDR family NAD(P)-dependent oxidoreductase [Bacteroidetes bacterium]|nr:SDR family NAD(P)-dependent oxidoreductase [Bacteroidota bacterium]
MTKTAVITGGSSGLGYALAELLGEQGYHIVLLARNKQRLDDAVAELAKKNYAVNGIICDITNENQVREASEKLKADYGKIDFLILSAGEVTTKLLCDYNGTAELKKDIDIDLWGTIQSAYFFTPLLVNGSKMLMISSGFGIMGAAGYSIYCAAKAGIVNFGESLRRELLYKNIAVYVACPGDMDTPQFRNEVKNQPEWMKQESPRKVMPVEVAAKKILKQCNGHKKYLIITGSDVKLLATASKILPRKWRDWLLDNMLPRPK